MIGNIDDNIVLNIFVLYSGGKDEDIRFAVLGDMNEKLIANIEVDAVEMIADQHEEDFYDRWEESRDEPDDEGRYPNRMYGDSEYDNLGEDAEEYLYSEYSEIKPDTDHPTMSLAEIRERYGSSDYVDKYVVPNLKEFGFAYLSP